MFADEALAAQKAGYEIFWLGSANTAEIAKLQILLSLTFPAVFVKFLATYGGGGVVGAEVSGIEGDDAENDSAGTVLGDTLTCRNVFGLPDNLAVIYFHDDEICWCIDCSDQRGGSWPIVSYSLAMRKIDRRISDSFDAFMRMHLGLYGQAG